MDSENAKRELSEVPSRDLEQLEQPEHPGPHTRRTISVRLTAPSRRGTPTERQETTPSVYPVSKSTEEKAAIQKRAEGRAKVPQKFRDSFKHFFFSSTGVLKILRMGLIIAALACFLVAQAHEWYVAITVLEICIVLGFILIYLLTLHRLLTFLHWPLLDLINSVITAVFLLVVAILAMEEKKRRHLFYVGGSLCLTAAIVCAIDGLVVTKMMRNNLKRIVGVQTETKQSRDQPPKLQPAPEPTPEPTPEPAPKPAHQPAPGASRKHAPKSTRAPSQKRVPKPVKPVPSSS
ncbi:CKLF-like MARVEL transmembrane domain-containing protein 1 [Cynocephalus volans]|uniref:CKLF-like MARVEL transmembrane domain-containing protein 1 n=1 Tax=Cynocephalus volans TaxID=110931 RepID=UPI002FCBA275